MPFLDAAALTDDVEGMSFLADVLRSSIDRSEVSKPLGFNLSHSASLQPSLVSTLSLREDVSELA